MFVTNYDNIFLMQHRDDVPYVSPGTDTLTCDWLCC